MECVLWVGDFMVLGSVRLVEIDKQSMLEITVTAEQQHQMANGNITICIPNQSDSHNDANQKSIIFNW